MDKTPSGEIVNQRDLTIDDSVEQLIFISDLHGTYEPLPLLEERITALNKKVQVIALGDYVIVGPSPHKVIDWVRTHAGQYAVAGNHDEIAIHSTDPDAPVWGESGAWHSLSHELQKYLKSLPQVLNLQWRGKSIRASHLHNADGSIFEWDDTVPLVYQAQANPLVDLTVGAHTHYPFAINKDGAFVANTGSLSLVYISHKLPDGRIIIKSGESQLEPPTPGQSSYLSVTIKDDHLDATVESFQYDYENVVSKLDQLGFTGLDWLRTIFQNQQVV